MKQTQYCFTDSVKWVDKRGWMHWISRRVVRRRDLADQGFMVKKIYYMRCWLKSSATLSKMKQTHVFTDFHQ